MKKYVFTKKRRAALKKARKKWSNMPKKKRAALKPNPSRKKRRK